MTDKIYNILGKAAIAYGAFTLAKNELVSRFAFGVPKVGAFKYPLVYRDNQNEVKTSYTGATLNFTMEIENKSFFGATLSGVTGRILYGKYTLANIVITKSYKISPHSKVVIGGIIILDFAQLVANGITMAQERDFLNKLSVDLTIKTPDLNIPYASAIQLA